MRTTVYSTRSVTKKENDGGRSGLEPDLRRDLHERQLWAGSGGSASFGERQKSPAMLALDLHEMEDRYWRDRGCHAGRHGYLKS